MSYIELVPRELFDPEDYEANARNGSKPIEKLSLKGPESQDLAVNQVTTSCLTHAARLAILSQHSG